MHTPGRGPRTGYDDIDEISDPDGVVALISKRRSNGALSLAIFRVYERDGEKEKTTFFSPKHIAAVRRVLDIAETKMAKLEDARAPQQGRVRP